MRKIKVLLTLGLLLVGLGQSVSAGEQDFVLYNRTGVDIYALYISPSDTEDWQENVIEGAQILNGGDLLINFSPDDEGIEMWDLRVEDEEGNALYWRDINLIEAHEFIIEPDGVARVKGGDE